MTNGWLSLGLGGTDAPAPTGTSAASDPNVILFRRKDADSFRELHGWLLSVIAHNISQGVDASHAVFDAGDPTRVERADARSAEAAAKLADARAAQVQSQVARDAAKEADRLARAESQVARDAAKEADRLARAQSQVARDAAKEADRLARAQSHAAKEAENQAKAGANPAKDSNPADLSEVGDTRAAAKEAEKAAKAGATLAEELQPGRPLGDRRHAGRCQGGGEGVESRSKAGQGGGPCSAGGGLHRTCRCQGSGEGFGDDSGW